MKMSKKKTFVFHLDQGHAAVCQLYAINSTVTLLSFMNFKRF